jgi:hypothetical protein
VAHVCKAISILLILIFSGCSGIGRRDGFGPDAVSERQAIEERRRIIENLAPEDASISPIRLAAVVDAMGAVMKDIDKNRFPQNINAVRKVLRDASLQDLRRIERILPEIEKKRKQDGVD